MHEPDQQAEGDSEPKRPANAGAPNLDRVGAIGIGSGDMIARAFRGPRDERRAARI